MADSTTNDMLIAGRYRQVRRIGAGGMSVVVMAEDTVLHRVVAVKMLAEHLAGDDDFVTRFRHEAIAVARLQHPNIVQIFDSGLDEASGRHYIVMEYVDGTPLSDMIKEGGAVDPERAVEIASQACEALERAHREGIIHRDVKPANLIIARDGTTKLADFGIAKAAEQTRVTQAGSVLGTVAYLSPEQATGGDTGPQSDIYSLAVCTYEMLGGRLPFQYKSITDLAMKQRDEQAPPLAQLNGAIPVELDRAVRVGLAHDPALRYPSAREFSAALRLGLRRRESDFVTSVINDPAAVTQMMKAPARTAKTRVARPLPPVAGPDQARVARRPAGGEPAARRKGGRGASRGAAVLLLLAAIAAAVIVGVSLLQTSSAPVVEDTASDQIQQMRSFVDENR